MNQPMRRAESPTRANPGLQGFPSAARGLFLGNGPPVSGMGSLNTEAWEPSPAGWL